MPLFSRCVGLFSEITQMNNPITIYGYAEGCPACTELKQLLDLLSIPYEFLSIGRESRERAILRDAGYETVPQAFSATGEALGGLSEFRKVARLGIQAAGMSG